MPTFQPFMFLGTLYMGADITNRVHQQMAVGLSHSNNSIDDDILSSAASIFYESIRTVSLRIIRELGPGIVVCEQSMIRFVRSKDWHGTCPQIEALQACDTTSDVLVVLNRPRDASVIRLGSRRRRKIIGHCLNTGRLSRSEVLDRSLQYLLENC